MEYRGLHGADADVDLTVGTTVATLSVPERMQLKGRCIIQNREADLLYTLNGVDPVAEDPSTGMTLYWPASLICHGSEMRDVRMVRAGKKDSKIHVRFESRLT